MKTVRRLLLALTLLTPGVPTWADTPSLFIAGDSTASNGAENGWGSHLQKFFDSSRLTVINRARAGRSSRTFVQLFYEALREKLGAETPEGVAHSRRVGTDIVPEGRIVFHRVKAVLLFEGLVVARRPGLSVGHMHGRLVVMRDL